MITKYCKLCGAQVVIDENKDKFFCSSCGAENIVDRINNGFAPNMVPQTAIAAPVDYWNSPNICFGFNTVPNHLKMYINIPCIGKEYVFNNGESIELHLPAGLQSIKLRIGSTTFTKTISIQNGILIHVNCSWDSGQFYVNSDYPQFIMNEVVNQQSKSGSKSSGWGCLGVGITVVAVFFGIILISGITRYLNAANDARSSTNYTTANTAAVSNRTSNYVNNNAVSTSVTSETSTGLDKEDFIDSCSELDFKSLARNPDEYIGQNFYFVCYVSSVRTGGLLSGYQRYFITYAFDLDEAQERVEEGSSDSISDAKPYCYDYDVCVWMLDNRDENDPEYVKVLEKDVVIVYGTFTGLTESQNSLTKETSEEVSLDVKYVEIVSD